MCRQEGSENTVRTKERPSGPQEFRSGDLLSLRTGVSMIVYRCTIRGPGHSYHTPFPRNVETCLFLLVGPKRYTQIRVVPGVFSFRRPVSVSCSTPVPPALPTLTPATSFPGTRFLMTVETSDRVRPSPKTFTLCRRRLRSQNPRHGRSWQSVGHTQQNVVLQTPLIKVVGLP